MAAANITVAASPSPTVRIAGDAYLDAQEFGARFGLKSSLSKSGRTLTLKSAWTTIELEADSRECQFNGVRMFFGDPVRISQGKFHLSLIDAEKRLTPLLLPGLGETKVPDLRTIVIDAGHGGHDPGKENHRLHVNEKTLALDTAKRLKKVLEMQGYRVILTRSTDTELSKNKIDDLRKRAEIANSHHADLFISLHYNAVGSSEQTVSGVEVYTLTPQHQFSTADPQRNDKNGATERLPGNANDHWSNAVGYQVQQRLILDLKADDRGLKYARWSVLRHAECPAILIESGFLSNDREARRIMQASYRQKIAEAVADGVQSYRNIVAGVLKSRSEK